MKRIITASNILLAIITAELFYPHAEGKSYPHLAVFILILKAMQLVYAFIIKDNNKRKSSDDILTVFYISFLLWQLLTARFGVLGKLLFPEPSIVFTMFTTEFVDMSKGLVNSIVLLASGYLLALFTAVPLGILVGWNGRLYRVFNPYAKVLGPIPPIVYIPYAIALLPTFRAASIFVIFIGAFWPIFVNTVHGVINIPARLIDFSRVLNIRGFRLYFRVILPGALPSICVGAELSLLFSFVMLTAAELIGATSGVGWYVRNFGDFGDYPRVISGLVFIGIVVTIITWGTTRLERRLLRWTDIIK